jgi:hypothetical protein
VGWGEGQPEAKPKPSRGGARVKPELRGAVRSVVEPANFGLDRRWRGGMRRLEEPTPVAREACGGLFGFGILGAIAAP